jgi:hypothetical protein
MKTLLQYIKESLISHKVIKNTNLKIKACDDLKKIGFDEEFLDDLSNIAISGVLEFDKLVSIKTECIKNDYYIIFEYSKKVNDKDADSVYMLLTRFTSGNNNVFMDLTRSDNQVSMKINPMKLKDPYFIIKVYKLNEALVSHKLSKDDVDDSIKITIDNEYNGKLNENVLKELADSIDEEIKDNINEFIIEKVSSYTYMFGIRFNTTDTSRIYKKRILSNIIVNHIIPYNLLFKIRKSKYPYDTFHYFGEMSNQLLYVVINSEFDNDKNQTILIK